ncbi:hypothetical protein R1sor_018259 [Riccia sorocarpa]|uniref:Uncharacterized protein n=1 Tax=Riccia sorocarpa TaxID=122646 RepID=A0ABD3IBX3_9MARC
MVGHIVSTWQYIPGFNWLAMPIMTDHDEPERPQRDEEPPHRVGADDSSEDDFPVVDLDNYDVLGADLDAIQTDLLYAGYAVQRSVTQLHPTINEYIPLARSSEHGDLQNNEVDCDTRVRSVPLKSMSMSQCIQSMLHLAIAESADSSSSSGAEAQVKTPQSASSTGV